MSERGDIYGGSSALPLRQGFHGLLMNFFERPAEDPAHLEAWGYTDRLSYAPGERIDFHLSTTARSIELEIVRDGAVPETVHRESGIPGRHHPTPPDASVSGCRWPVGYTLTIPEDWRSGGYIVFVRVADERGTRQCEAFFCLRPRRKQAGNVALILATSTWIAYNNWAGSNHYEGLCGPEGNRFGTHLSTQRPWHRGCILLPEGAPGPCINMPEAKRPGWAFWFNDYAYAFIGGFAKYATAAGWAMFDRHFARWAEANGYGLDYYTQHDLDQDPDLLSGYRVVALVGHDEYWSTPMRDHLDAFVEGGGRLARFGGNFLWQVRLEDEGRTQVCYKTLAATDDPARDDPDRRHLQAGIWEAPGVARPGASSVGLNGSRGIFSLTGGYAPRASGGFTVYRPDHWALAGTDLYYADVFGSEQQITGFEVDGLTYTFRDGLPEPTYEDGALPGTEILALTPAALKIELHGHYGEVTEGDQGEMDQCLGMSYLIYGDAEHADEFRYGCGAVVVAPRDEGEIFCAGATKWVHGLRDQNPFVERITHNVLQRYLGRSQSR